MENNFQDSKNKLNFSSNYNNLEDFSKRASHKEKQEFNRVTKASESSEKMSQFYSNHKIAKLTKMQSQELVKRTLEKVKMKIDIDDSPLRKQFNCDCDDLRMTVYFEVFMSLQDAGQDWESASDEAYDAAGWAWVGCVRGCAGLY